MNEYCKKCGNRLEAGTKFCTKCGEKSEFGDISNINITELDENYIKKPIGTYFDIFLDGTIESVRNATETTFNKNKFDVKWDGTYTGKATKGSKAANIALGALAQFYKIDFKLFVMPNKDVVVRIVQSDGGGWGGIAGMAMASGKFTKIIESMTNDFRVMGIYKSREPK